jgi:DNA mismatch repair protein MutS2
MNSGAYKTLEFDKILKALGSLTSTPLGLDRAISVCPSTDLDVIRESLQETSEACRFRAEGKEIPLAQTPDVRPHIETLRVEHHGLDAASLAELATLARVTDQVKSTLGSPHPDLNLLPKLAGSLPDLGSLRASIEKAIDGETATVKDNASPELRSLRARIFKLKNRLRSMLESYFRQKDSRKILQDQIVTERNGRAVLPVRSECRGQLVGIVHGTSSSGATLFIEPLSTVEINNDIVSLEEQERQEVERILQALTKEARLHRSELTQAVEVLAHLDLIQAKARLSELHQGTEPQVRQGLSLRLVSARHPLLIAKVAEKADEPIPSREAVAISFQVNEQKAALIFTGPNTGGKTVALKTAGLLAFMAQSGLHVPAASESSFPVFKKIFADIGDEQSIGSSLSTFSAHLNNIVEMDKGLESPSLVLLDEVGTGTDPAEGGALGTALVEHFRTRGALVLASTHHGMLKSYATTAPGVGSASFQFDPETYEPIYELVEGSTGRSLAFEMALRLGLSEKVVERARALQNEKERQVEDLLAQLETEGQELARARESLSQERRAVDETLRRQRALERELATSKEQQLNAFQDELREKMAGARSELDEILEAAQAQRTAETATAPPVEQIEQLAGQQIEEMAKQLLPQQEEHEPLPDLDVCAGMQVKIASLGLTGVVVETLGHDVEVMVRDKKLRIPLANLAAASPQKAESPDTANRFTHTQIPDRKAVPQELNVIGCTVDEAISQADKFLDDAFLAEHQTVRLIHGLGKRRLKNAIHDWLESHPHVTGQQSEQSGAVTVVELKV